MTRWIWLLTSTLGTLPACASHPVGDGPPPVAVATPEERRAFAETLDAYVDQRFEAPPGATEELVDLASRSHLSIDDVEALLRANRTSYPDPPQPRHAYTAVPIRCYHVDYSSIYYVYVPSRYDPATPTSLVFVGHGGNSSMTKDEARTTALEYIQAYAPALGEQGNAIVVAAATERGWGQIGNSLMLTTISKVQRDYNVDPDRIYVTGQSMGGHLSWRSALALGDRWGAVSPQSGGYDYVADGSIANVFTTPGYTTFGINEPYGLTQINLTDGKWLEDHRYPWIIVQKNGGHDIYADEIPKVGAFFAAHPRDMYRTRTFLKQAGEMRFVRDFDAAGWAPYTVDAGRPLRWNLRHWVEVEPRPDVAEPLTVYAENVGKNRIEIRTKNVRRLRVYLHSKMVDFGQPVHVIVNGDELLAARVTPSLKTMLDLVREFDDRGRIYHAAVDLDVTTDADVPDPSD
jgi:acetyl esterase/lipase